MGMAFLDNKTLKKLGVDNSDQLKEIFGSNNVIATDHSNGFNIHWK